jgi:hypothetical protein
MHTERRANRKEYYQKMRKENLGHGKNRQAEGTIALVIRAFVLALLLSYFLKGTSVVNRMYAEASETENTI